MRKYGRFGISFLKSYLIHAGANPVFYLAKDSRPLFPINAAGYGHPGLPRCQWPTRASLFDEMVPECDSYLQNRLLSLPAEEGQALSGETLRVHDLLSFLRTEVFSLMKFFDSARPDDDLDNYYMEREWRNIGTLNFELSAVRRVILPERFSVRLREDLPRYGGQVQWSDAARPSGEMA